MSVTKENSGEGFVLNFNPVWSIYNHNIRYISCKFNIESWKHTIGQRLCFIVIKLINTTIFYDPKNKSGWPSGLRRCVQVAVWFSRRGFESHFWQIFKNRLHFPIFFLKIQNEYHYVYFNLISFFFNLIVAHLLRCSYIIQDKPVPIHVWSYGVVYLFVRNVFFFTSFFIILALEIRLDLVTPLIDYEILQKIRSNLFTYKYLNHFISCIPAVLTRQAAYSYEIMLLDNYGFWSF